MHSIPFLSDQSSQEAHRNIHLCLAHNRSLTVRSSDFHTKSLRSHRRPEDVKFRFDWLNIDPVRIVNRAWILMSIIRASFEMVWYQVCSSKGCVVFMWLVFQPASWTCGSVSCFYWGWRVGFPHSHRCWPRMGAYASYPQQSSGSLSSCAISVWFLTAPLGRRGLVI